MKKIASIFAAILLFSTLCVCGRTAEASADEIENGVTTTCFCPLEDGRVYIVNFNTDSSMFHVNESLNGKAILTVENGKMSVHATLQSVNILNLYQGKASDAVNALEEELLQYTVDTVTYSDGMTEEVFGFDIPVEEIGKEFDLSLLGKKGKWYDHVVSVSLPAPAICELEDGDYTVSVELSGGSGKASVTSPAEMRVDMGGAVLKVEWSSPNYDYMIVEGITYLPVNKEGNSVFEIPVLAIGDEFAVIADTTAMGTPHEIEYTIKCDLQ